MRQTHEDVVEDLEELEGFRRDSDLSEVSWVRRGARWTPQGGGASTLRVAPLDGEPGYELLFGPYVPHFLIVRACAEAAADCQRCGTACEGDCGEPDGVVHGIDGDGSTYSRVL